MIKLIAKVLLIFVCIAAIYKFKINKTASEPLVISQFRDSTISMTVSEKLAYLRSRISPNVIPDPPIEPEFTQNDRYSAGFHMWDRQNDLSKWLVFSFGFSLAADVSPHRYDFWTYPAFNKSIYTISNQQVVYVRSDDLTQFAQQVMPTVNSNVEFILVSGNGDVSIPTEVDEATRNTLLNSKSIKVWYTQNLANKTHSKLRPIPIGNDYHAIYTRPYIFNSPTNHPWTQNVYSERLASAIPFHHRLPIVFVHFRSQTDEKRPWGHGQPTSRAAILDTIQKTLPKTHYIMPSGNKQRNELWRDQTPYAFVASAYGNGLDCHRTWEALELGQVVIMIKSNHADFWEMFEGLPVIFIDSWNDVTADKLEKWHKEWSIKLSDPSYYASVQEKLHMEYWMKKIRGHFKA